MEWSLEQTELVKDFLRNAVPTVVEGGSRDGSHHTSLFLVSGDGQREAQVVQQVGDDLPGVREEGKA